MDLFVADSLVKQLEREGGEAPPGMVELDLADDLEQITPIEGFDSLGYRILGDAGRRDIVDIHTGVVAATDVHAFDAVDALRIASHERSRAHGLADALEHIAGNPLFHAGEDTRQLAQHALDQYEAEVGNA